MMHLLLCIGISVFVLHDHWCQSVISSKSASLKLKTRHEVHDMVQPKLDITADTDREDGLTYTHVTHSQEDDFVNHLQNNRDVSKTFQMRTNTQANVVQPNPCSVKFDATDTIVDCTGMFLTNISSTWFSRNTTVILLDNNHITIVDNVSLSSLTHLRYLNLSSNKIIQIQENAFSGLVNLETLNLEANKLNEHAYPPGIFDSLYRLKNLYLRMNAETENLPGILFRQLKSLQSLSVDAVGETFSLDIVFTSLTTLVVSGDVKVIDHTSFRSFPHTTELRIDRLPSLTNFTDTALKPLQSLDILTIYNMHIGIEKSLQILKPLTGKNMTSISFSKVYFLGKSRDFNIYNNEGILNAEKTQYLRKICVKHLSLIKSFVVVIKINAFSGGVLSNCLKTIDLSSNELSGNLFVIPVMMHFKNIESVNLENEERSCYIKRTFPNDRKELHTDGQSRGQIPTNYHSQQLTKRGTDYSKKHSDTTINIKRMLQWYQHPHRSSYDEITSATFPDTGVESKITIQCPLSIPSADVTRLPTFRAYTSKSFKYFKARGIASNAGSLDGNYIFVGGSNLRYLDLRDNGFKNFFGNFVGLDVLQTFMLSGNDASNLSETFFDGVCRLAELDLSNCHLDGDFMTSESARIFQNLHDLKRLDLSLNFLNTLQNGTFGSNNLIEELNLSKNRFRNIPFELRNTPKLKRLDLRENSITILTSRERNEIDSLATQPAGFRLLISGNILSCGCNNFRFLIWLHTTSARLDDGNNFTCMNDEGQLSYLSNVTDLETLWRKCCGRIVLLMSLILLCSMITGFLLVFFVWKNKTFIKSKILQILTGYKLKMPQDYPTGVFIGYAEKDYNFPCFVLCKFIEEELNLTTYIYNRDNIPDCDRASSIVDAINTSWRIILVVTDKFVHNDDWSMFTTRTAIYGLSPANPARVVVLVQENLQHRLPQEVLCSVPEENILVVSSWKISDKLERKLRISLMNIE